MKRLFFSQELEVVVLYCVGHKATMPRKRKSENRSKSAGPKKKSKTKLTVYDRLLLQLTVGSIWRVATKDTVKTASGKEVLSGWQRCKILSRTEDNVTVQYLDDKEDDDPLTYGIPCFVASADLAPSHFVDLTGHVETAVSHEQSVFVMQERGELLPLQKKKVSDPTKWAKNQRSSFDKNWGQQHDVPVCTIKDCKLDCAKITNEIIGYARSCCQRFAERDVNGRNLWLSLFVRSLNTKLSDAQIWCNYHKLHVQPGRQSWSCTYCKCNPNSPPDHTIADVNHRFKQTPKKRSKYAECPDYVAGVTFKKKVIDECRSKSKRCNYFVPMAAGKELQVHRDVFRDIFNVGQRTLFRVGKKDHVDGRAGCSGRKPHDVLRKKIENFWINEVEHQPSHYNATSTTQTIVGVNSIAHGWLIFLAKHFNAKYEECVSKCYFPGFTPHIPSSLPEQDVPVIACADCIDSAHRKSLSQVICPHIPKLGFFKSVTSTFDLTLKRPGSDQCEKCNTLHNRIALQRALGQHADADAAEDLLYAHQEKLSSHTITGLPPSRACVTPSSTPANAATAPGSPSTTTTMMLSGVRET